MSQMNLQILTQLTGDPFADTGGLVLKYLSENEPTKGKSLPELIEWLADKYVRQWDAKINAYFLNSTITQGVYKGEEKMTKTLEYFRDLLADRLSGKEGWCRITGQFGKLYPAGRDNHILSGSGTYINFHAGFEPGLYLSKEVIVRMFAVPFGTMQLGDKIALVYTNVEVANEFLVGSICRNNIDAPGKGLGKSVLKSEFTNPTNALFAFAHGLWNDLRFTFRTEGVQKEGVQINLMHFTNFATKPDIQLYAMPGKVFEFYVSCLDPAYQTAWERFARAHHRSSQYKDAQFNADTQIWTAKKESFELKDYQNWRNPVYQNLLFGQSIVGLLRRWCKSHPFPFSLIKDYLIHLRNMEKHTIEVVRRAADFIVEDDNDNIKKALGKINGAKYPHHLRSFFTALDIKNYKRGANDPLFRVEDFTEYLFGDTANWRETRDVLLIAIYEKLHEQKKIVDVSDPTDQEDDIDTETQN